MRSPSKENVHPKNRVTQDRIGITPAPITVGLPMKPRAETPDSVSPKRGDVVMRLLFTLSALTLLPSAPTFGVCESAARAFAAAADSYTAARQALVDSYLVGAATNRLVSELEKETEFVESVAEAVDRITEETEGVSIAIEEVRGMALAAATLSAAVYLDLKCSPRGPGACSTERLDYVDAIAAWNRNGSDASERRMVRRGSELVSCVGLDWQ